MANVPMKSLKLPGLSDLYTFLQNDTNLAVTGKAADAKKTGDALAPEYNGNSTYAVGEYVRYNGVVYKCKTAISTAEAWTAAHWTETNVADGLHADVTDVKSAIGDDYDYPQEKKTGYINSTVWAITGSSQRHIVIPVKASDSVSVYAGSEDSANIAFLKSYNATEGESVDFSTETGFTATISIPKNRSDSYTTPTDALYLYVLAGNNSPDYNKRMPKSIIINGYDAIATIVDNIGTVNEKTDTVGATVERITPIVDSFEATIGTDGQAW